MAAPKLTKRTCPMCGGRKDFYALACRKCHTPAKPLAGRTGENHPAWRGGVRIDKDGYVKRYAPNHPWPRKGGYVFEHVMVVEVARGYRLQSGEVVHHKNHDKRDNRLENLKVLGAGEHSRHHRSLDTHLRRRESGRFARKEVCQ